MVSAARITTVSAARTSDGSLRRAATACGLFDAQAADVGVRVFARACVSSMSDLMTTNSIPSEASSSRPRENPKLKQTAWGFDLRSRDGMTPSCCINWSALISAPSVP